MLLTVYSTCVAQNEEIRFFPSMATRMHRESMGKRNVLCQALSAKPIIMLPHGGCNSPRNCYGSGKICTLFSTLEHQLPCFCSHPPPPRFCPEPSVKHISLRLTTTTTVILGYTLGKDSYIESHLLVGKTPSEVRKRNTKVTGTMGVKERWQSPGLALKQNSLGEEGTWIDVSWN